MAVKVELALTVGWCVVCEQAQELMSLGAVLCLCLNS